MPARRFHAPEAREGRRVWLDPAESAYLRRVLRLEPGARLEVFDGEGSAFDARFVDADADGRCGLVVGSPVPAREPGLRLTVAVALPKGDGMTPVVRQLTEVGAFRVLPLVTERSEGPVSASRVTRWQAAALSGTRQCGRARIPRVDVPSGFHAFVAAAPAGRRWIASPRPLAGVGAGPPGGRAAPSGSGIVVAIGPEGGFTDRELGLAEEARFVRLDLGERVLRTGTAAVVAAARLLLSAREER